MKLSTTTLWAALAAGILALATACSSAVPTDTQPAAGTSEPASVSPDSTSVTPRLVPDLDRSIHKVPLADILFDTFGAVNARFVSLSEISDELQTDLRDAITPVERPVYGGPDALPWLTGEHLVIGYESGADAFAYPINILNLHEIVNDTIGGVPVLITYCPLCFSGVVFSREVDGEILSFGNTSALYQSDLVMYDHQTGSYWFQVAGEAVVGSLTGSRLKPLPSATMPWEEWKALHPGTRLITGAKGQETLFAAAQYASGFGSGYQDRINDDRFAFPVDTEKLDGRLSSGEIVLTVEAGGGIAVFPLGLIGDGAANAEVGGLPVVVFTTSGGRSVGAFSRFPVPTTSDGRPLTFDYRVEDSVFVDRETGSAWDLAGRAQDGPLTGSRLDRVSTRRSFWFAVAISFPGVEIFKP